jgi:histidine triad (HIT) family protein
METIFSKIIAREIPAEIIYEDEHTIVIPDKFPSMPGQLVVISKRQVDYIFKLSNIEYQALMETTKLVAQALDKTLNSLRTCVVIEGFEVPHVHVRLYPCLEEKTILEPRSEASAETLKLLADKVRSEIL